MFLGHSFQLTIPCDDALDRSGQQSASQGCMTSSTSVFFYWTLYHGVRKYSWPNITNIINFQIWNEKGVLMAGFAKNLHTLVVVAGPTFKFGYS